MFAQELEVMALTLCGVLLARLHTAVHGCTGKPRRHCQNSSGQSGSAGSTNRRM